LVGLNGINPTNLITAGLSETPSEAAHGVLRLLGCSTGGLGGLTGCLLGLLGGLARSFLPLTCYLPCLLGGLTRRLLGLLGGSVRGLLGSLARRILDTLLLGRLIH
jgi:hypothetical protein